MPPQPLTTRFAPSPTGLLHLGHAVHMLYLWGLADLLGARVLLRIEDHDRQRCRAEYEAAILEDLDWLGFEPENALTPRCRQSGSEAAYREALDKLRRGHNVYRCVCTRKDLAARCAASAAGERIYDGRCRAANHPRGVAGGLRLQWSGGAESFADGLLGARRQDPARQCGDLLLQDRLGQWTYQFAAVVDDVRSGVNLIVRGEDLLASSGRQIRLARLLGRAEPARFYHHPLAADAAGVKLSKRRRAPALRELRAAGMRPAEVLGEAARAVGLQAEAGPLERRAIAGLLAAHHGLG